MPVHPVIREFVERTPIVDTHEHLIEESRRLGAPREDDKFHPCNDWAYLFRHYAEDDLRSAGMPEEVASVVWSPTAEPLEKWRAVEPYFNKAKNTGYLRAGRIAAQVLYGEEDVNADTVERITEKFRARVRPGFYREVLRDVANLELCQVNSLEHLFCETAQPDLLMQDLAFAAFCSPPALGAGKAAGVEPVTLADWHRVIDWHFATYGPRAVAIKSAVAYQRRLDYDDVPAPAAAPLFERYAKAEARDPGAGPRALTDAELKALGDHLFNYCVRRAIDFDLPIKLHTGYYVGNNRMPLHRLRRNASDAAELLLRYPQARFVLMHIGYPYQDEFVALAKHFPGAYIDLCWAWIISPGASVRFLKEALTTAPASKLFAFGGDYYTLEPVVGHARIARQGVTQALSELVEEGWLGERDALDAASRILRDNAHEVFRIADRLAAWG